MLKQHQKYVLVFYPRLNKSAEIERLNMDGMLLFPYSSVSQSLTWITQGWEKGDVRAAFLSEVLGRIWFCSHVSRMPTLLTSGTFPPSENHQCPISLDASSGHIPFWSQQGSAFTCKSAFNSTGPAIIRYELIVNNSSHLDPHTFITSAMPLCDALGPGYQDKGTLTSRRSLFVLPPSDFFVMELWILPHKYSYIYFNSFLPTHSFLHSSCRTFTKYLFQSTGKTAYFISSSALLLGLNGSLACLTYFLLLRIIISFRLWNVPSWMQEEPSVTISTPWLILSTCINFPGRNAFACIFKQYIYTFRNLILFQYFKFLQ